MLKQQLLTQLALANALGEGVDRTIFLRVHLSIDAAQDP